MNKAAGETISIAVGWNVAGWHEKFAEALDEKIASGWNVRYDIINLHRHDWMEAVKPHDVVLWKSSHMGNRRATIFKEKIYFLEKFAKKVVVPNFDTIWHFESKIAQSYLFAHHCIPTPRTFVSSDYADVTDTLDHVALPLVFKQSAGAGSSNVQMVRTRKRAERLSRSDLRGYLYLAARHRYNSRLQVLLHCWTKRWFWEYAIGAAIGLDPPGAVYWQDFVPNNDADLRITVIGKRYAYGFWRRNRENDFRASGSGRIDFERPIPEDVVRFCLNVNRQLNFDSMAYDVLFRNGEFVINEISYGYLDSVPYKTAGHYELKDDGELAFLPGHVWPQALWVDWTLERCGAVGKQPAPA